jgi:glycosyltransferase involved in cell wall biosynthesis
VDLGAALRAVRDAPFVVDALRAAEDLAVAAGQDRDPRAVRTLVAAVEDPVDELTAVAAVHALARVFDDEADAVLSELLSHRRPFLREHAAWALAARLPRLDAVGRLVAAVRAGGFTGVLAQRTLEGWARSAPDHVALAVEGALAAPQETATRARLVETLGLVPGPVATRAVRRVAGDDAEEPAVRVAALAALGDRAGDPRAADLVLDLARTGGELGAVARLAALDLGLVPAPATVPGGLSVAQVFLHADLDRELSRAGTGDNGGIATLLVRLGDALAAGGADRVLTLSRGTAEAAAEALARPATGHALTPVPLLPGEPVAATEAWPARVAVTRGLRRALTAYGRVDVLHLRMADVGSLAAAEVAATLGIPVVFTLAPDPHAVVHALDMTGALGRTAFGVADEREHYWFRARLVQRLAAGAAHTVLFPRPEIREDLRELLGIDVDAEPGRYTVVPEGIDLTLPEAAARRASGTGRPDLAVRDLVALLDDLPGHRQGLPVALSVGRLHPVKGMATVVEAWATDARVRDRCNLVIVGGDLDRPSPDERDQLAAIAAVLAAEPRAADGLVLAGHRPNAVVAAWLRAAHAGSPPVLAPGGAYVCGSLKEEFGLALLEALAAGLPVVAPHGGGPATYVEDGVTGLLVDTGSPAAVARALDSALGLASGPGAPARADRARRLVRERFTVQGMADALLDVYAGLTAPAPR